MSGLLMNYTSGHLPHGNPKKYHTAVKRVTKALLPHLREFDSILVTGLSGILVGAPLALRWGKHLAILRKPDEQTQSGAPQHEGTLGRRIVIIDDLVATGQTLDRLMRAVDDHNFAARYGEGNEARVVYLVLYHDEGIAPPRGEVTGYDITRLDGPLHTVEPHVSEIERNMVVKAMHQFNWREPKFVP